MENSSFKVFLILAFCEGVFATFEKHVFQPDQKTWHDARKYCRTHYIDLSSIYSLKEEKLVENATAGMNNSLIWIGLYSKRSMNPIVWKWTGGEQAQFSNWHPGQPDNPSIEFCGALIKGQGWHNVGCTKEHSFVCFNKATFVNQEKTWEEALNYCRVNGADLASVLSKTEMRLLSKESLVAQAQNVWTGLRWLGGSWLWVNGDKLKYEAWFQGIKPQCPAWNSGCGALSVKEKVWKNLDCNIKLHFFCR
ncbi:hypothetical protein DPEC_G00049330 [Dallia pectoralis]|uniref:Uncharacterized protein n=1 Tax=Dallia pectoralis TaxID=75939 RepID=A0ACC2HBM7_DALPE|nr:hypothetical protein DPEC_G00049330 [Dallia pectoralis]